MKSESTPSGEINWDPRLEACEAAAWGDFYRAAPPEVARACGLGVQEQSGGVLTLAGAADVLAMNRVVGAGIEQPLSDADIESIIDIFDKANAPRFFIQLAPPADTVEVRRRLDAHGLRLYNHWIKLHRAAGPVPESKTVLRIERIGGAEAEDFARVLTLGFGWSEELRPLIAASVGRLNWHHYLAYEGGEPVATGATYIDREWAWLDMASTLAEHRGKGAQGALLARRIDDAFARGCTDLIVETAEPKDEGPAPSHRNTLRYGFKAVYKRANYIWEA
jgi:hypothetical protein